MARVPYLKPEEASGELRETLEAIPKNLVGLVAQAQGVAGPHLSLIGALLAKTNLDPVLREMTILLVGRRTGAEYEWNQHVGIASRAGVREDQIEAIEQGEIGAGCCDAPARAVLAFAAQLLQGLRPDEPCFQALKTEAHLNEREIVELVLLVGTYQALAMLMTSLDIELDESVDAAEFAGLLDHMNR